jgi:hypothetical protein
MELHLQKLIFTAVSMAPSRGHSTRVLFVLVDGLGDVTIPGFGDRTPMEVAHTPILDAIAGGITGIERSQSVLHDSQN